MPSLTVKTPGQADAAPVYLARPSLAVIAMLFCGYLAVGLPLPVIPLFVHDKLGFGNLVVGLVIGIQFLATVLTRGYAGHVTDHQGGKRAALQGAAFSALGGLLYLVAAIRGLSPVASLAIVIAGRLVAGLGESQFVTGCVSWSIASVGPQRAGMSMSWTGIAMFAALAVGAPVGMALYQQLGLQVAMAACIVAPLLAVCIAFGATSYVSPPGHRLPFYRVISQIWREGLGLMLQGVGLSGLTAFASLYFAMRGWGHAGLVMTAFGIGFILMRLPCGSLVTWHRSHRSSGAVGRAVRDRGACGCVRHRPWLRAGVSGPWCRGAQAGVAGESRQCDGRFRRLPRHCLWHCRAGGWPRCRPVRLRRRLSARCGKRGSRGGPRPD
jgi:MFS family permease